MDICGLGANRRLIRPAGLILRVPHSVDLLHSAVSPLGWRSREDCKCIVYGQKRRFLLTNAKLYASMVYFNECRRTQSSKMPVRALSNQCFLACPHLSAIFQRSQKRAEKAHLILVRRYSTDSYDADTPHGNAPKSPKKTLNDCGKPLKSGTISNRHAQALARRFQ